MYGLYTFFLLFPTVNFINIISVICNLWSAFNRQLRKKEIAKTSEYIYGCWVHDKSMLFWHAPGHGNASNGRPSERRDRKAAIPLLTFGKTPAVCNRVPCMWHRNSRHARFSFSLALFLSFSTSRLLLLSIFLSICA